MVIRNAYYGTVGPLPYDDDYYYALDTNGKARVGTAPVGPDDVARLVDVTKPGEFTIPVLLETSLPTPVEALRGRLARIAGAAGETDKVYVCLKDAADAYVWMQFVIVP
jgi:hypothetical protein